MRRRPTLLGPLLAVTAALLVLLAPHALAQDALADARVDGVYEVTQTMAEAHRDSGYEVGDVESYQWVLVATCPEGACSIALDYGDFQVPLERDGARYSGALEHDTPDECGDGTIPDSGNLYTLEVADAVSGIATELRGTVVSRTSEYAEGDCSSIATSFSWRSDVVAVLLDPPAPTSPLPVPSQSADAPNNDATAPNNDAPAPNNDATAPTPVGQAEPPPAAAPSAPGEARLPGRSVIAAGVTAADDVSRDLGLVLTNLVIAALLAFLLVFPSELFNRTLETNYDEVRGWFRWRRSAPGSTPPLPGGEAADTPAARRGWIGFAAITAISALLYALLDPDFGLNRNTATGVAGVAAALVVLTIVGGLASAAYLRRRFGDAAYRVRSFPGALVVAAVCVAISRLVGFTPGYLYGLIAGFAFRHQLDDEGEGRQTLITSLALFGVAIAAWFAWLPVAGRVADGGAPLWLLVLDAALVSVFVTGVEGLIFGLVPLKFLSGSKLMRWSKATWGAVYVLALFTFLHVVVRSSGAAEAGSSVVTIVALFLVFGAVSVAFWGYFRFRSRPELPA